MCSMCLMWFIFVNHIDTLEHIIKKRKEKKRKKDKELKVEIK